ncbi:hypothetical protein GUJ93_ZPchr0006g43259 [Zizania palustris]|uniref:Uncharacterized protein n=1 Tax=Zizania palustris TaxID=103762 RepID=A0A8J5W243_ZIZPA|nr:hypothetical protein GUJ93_ZPchr0006g43259 [Zizania palustris]
MNRFYSKGAHASGATWGLGVRQDRLSSEQAADVDLGEPLRRAGGRWARSSSGNGAHGSSSSGARLYGGAARGSSSGKRKL